MDLFNILAGLASILSLAFAGYLHHKTKVQSVAESGNIHVLRERLRSVETSLRSSATILQMLIRRADDRTVGAEELQNIARSARASLVASILEARGVDEILKDWTFGQLLRSEGITDAAVTKHRVVDDDDSVRESE